MTNMNTNNDIYYQDAGAKPKFKRKSLAKKKSGKKSPAKKLNADTENKSLQVLVPEKYVLGKCGPKHGFCNGNRYCNMDADCGPASSHKVIENNPNYKYRLCVGADKDCVRKASCDADKVNEINCRLVFA